MLPHFHTKLYKYRIKKSQLLSIQYEMEGICWEVNKITMYVQADLNMEMEISCFLILYKLLNIFV